MDEKFSKKRTRDGESVSDPDLLEVKRIRDDLFSFFDEADPNPTSHDLDSVMKSFEEEILASSSAVVVDLTSESGDSQPELGYLLEASDDELGLPPSSVKSSGNDFSESVRADSGESTIIGDNLWGFDDQFPSYDSFGLGAGGDLTSEYVAFDGGLFEYSDACLDYSDYSWRLGTSPFE